MLKNHLKIPPKRDNFRDKLKQRLIEDKILKK